MMLFSIGILMCPVSPAVLSLSPPLLSLSESPSRSPVLGPWCCMDFSGGPKLSKLFFMLYSGVFALVFSLSLSLLSLSCLSLLYVLYPAKSQHDGYTL